MKKYEVRYALIEDVHEGRIWIKLPESEKLREDIRDKRRIARVERKHGKSRHTYCEVLLADQPYTSKWEERAKTQLDWGDIAGKKLEAERIVFLSAWYRSLLKIEKAEVGTEMDLEIKPLKGFHPYVLLYGYPYCHPQLIVRTAAAMSVLALGLGILSIGVSLFTLMDWVKFLGASVGVAGFVLALSGLWGITRGTTRRM